jgi:hypothetical protein
MTKRRRRHSDPHRNAARLLAILEANLVTATSPALRERLQQAIAALKERARDAGAR